MRTLWPKGDRLLAMRQSLTARQGARMSFLLLRHLSSLLPRVLIFSRLRLGMLPTFLLRVWWRMLLRLSAARHRPLVKGPNRPRTRLQWGLQIQRWIVEPRLQQTAGASTARKRGGAPALRSTEG